MYARYAQAGTLSLPTRRSHLLDRMSDYGVYAAGYMVRKRTIISAVSASAAASMTSVFVLEPVARPAVVSMDARAYRGVSNTNL